jgi:hypothetical protein
MPVYRLATFHNTVLVVDILAGVLCHGKPSGMRYRAAYIWIPTGKPNCCFAIFDSEAVIALTRDNDVAHTGLFSFRLSKVKGGGIALRHPFSGNFFSAIVSTGPYGDVTADRTEIRAWETFTLQGIAETVPPAVAAEVESLEHCLKNMANGSRTVSYLSDPGHFLTRARLTACLQLLLPDQLQWLGRALPSKPDAVRNLAALMTDDIWLSQALPDLVAHREACGVGARQIDLPDNLDFLASCALDGRYVSIGQTLNSFARRSCDPSKKICIVATGRNEGLYILEWIAYHRALGVEAFFIYTNDNDDGSDPLLESLAEAGVITWIRNKVTPGTNPQFKAYAHAFQMLPELLDYRWAAVIDIDEFIVVDSNRFETISQFIDNIECEKTDAIALSWVLFGPHGHSRRTNLPVIERFQTRSPAVHPLIKSICRTNVFVHSTCHHPMWDDFTQWTYRYADGTLHPQSRNSDITAFAPMPSDDTAWINHYYSKSAEEFILRRASSNANAVAIHPSGDYFLSHVAQNFIVQFQDLEMPRDTRIVSAAPNFTAEMINLRGLPGVAAAASAMELRYAERLRELAMILANDPRFHVVGSPEKWFADIVAASVRDKTGLFN